MKNGPRFFVAVGIAALALGTSAATAGINPVLVVTPAGCCTGQGFTIQGLDGTVTGSVGVPDGADPIGFGAAADGAIAYDDASHGTGDAGPVWLVAPGHVPLELDSSPADFDASISNDGSKVTFARYDMATDSSNLYVVGANGSGLTLVAVGQDNDNLSEPMFSPDGNSIAYYCRPGNTDLGTSLGCGPTIEGTYASSGVMLMNADGTDKRMIVRGSAGVGDGRYSWSPDGQSLTGTSCVSIVVADVQSCGPTQVVAYRTDGSDLFRGEDPSLQVTNETIQAGAFNPQYTPDGAQILFMKVVDNAWALYAVGSDGANEQPTSLAPQASFSVVPPTTGGGPPPTVNMTQPAGVGLGQIVVRSQIEQCHGLIVLAATGAYTRCVPFPAGGDGAVYAPAADGSIVLSDDKAGTGGDGGPVWLVKSDGDAVELDSSKYDFDPSISHDGSKITFARLDPATNSSDIYAMNSDGSGLTRVASGGGTNVLSTPTFSPDGGTIAYSCGPVGPGATGAGCGPLTDGTYRPTGVMLVNADGTDKRMILVGVSGPMSWSPDGNWLALTHCVTKVVDNVWSCDPVQVFAYRTDGSDAFNSDDPRRQVTHVTSIPEGAFDPQFSSDGTQILFGRNVDGRGDEGDFAYVVNRDGSDDHEVSLTPDPPHCIGGIGGICDLPPSWGMLVPPDGGGAAPRTVRAAQVSVPVVRALTLRVAKRHLAAVDLAAKIRGRRYSSHIPRGLVISQYPHAHAHARLGKKHRPVVKLVLSRGKRPKTRR